MGDIKRIEHNDEFRSYDFEVLITYTYTAGHALERFLTEIKERGKIVGTRCSDCGLTYVPPTLFCERCFATLDKFVEMPKWGKLVTYAINYEDLDGNKLGEPQVIAMVHIDGAHGGLIHTLLGVERQDIRIGMPVEIVFVPEGDRIGSIIDISHFRPIRSS